MAEIKKEPSLYSLYNKQYDFDDLLQSADKGISDFITNLKRGDKDYDKYMEAYSNMMSGIKDGSITFLNGGFHDSRGRYQNDKKRDYYGLIARYLYGIQNGMKEYTKPEDTSRAKWEGNVSLGKTLRDRLFNSENPDILNFLDLDDLDPETKLRGTTNRTKALQKEFEYLNSNFDNLYRDLDDTQKARAKENLAAALNAFADGTISKDEYLALSRAVGGIDFRALMGNKTEESEQLEALRLAEEEQAKQFARDSSYEAFLKANNLMPGSGTRYNSYAIGNNTYATDPRLAKLFSDYSDDDLRNILGHIVTDSGYRFNNEGGIKERFGDMAFDNRILSRTILDALGGRLQLMGLGDGRYMIRGIRTPRNSVFVYNKNTGQIEDVDMHSLAPIRKLLVADYNNWKASRVPAGQNPLAQYEEYAGLFKLGGVISAKKGDALKANLNNTTNWYDDLVSREVGADLYTSNLNTDKLYAGDFSNGKLLDPYASPNNGNSLGRYAAIGYGDELIGSDEYRLKIRDIEGSADNPNYYYNFSKLLFDDNGNLTDVGMKWAKMTDDLLPADSQARILDSDGKVKTNWSVKNNGVYSDSTPTTYNNVRDYVNKVRFDLVLGARHNVFLNEGKRYFYKDADGNKKYVNLSPEELKKYNVSDKADYEGWDKPDTYVRDYEITGNTDNLGNSSNIYLSGKDKTPNKFGDNILNTINSYIPEGNDIARFISRIRGNKNNYKTIDSALKPKVELTDELYSPVTGAFGEMLHKFKLAARTRRMGSWATTSDALVNAAQQLDYNNRANDEEDLGKLTNTQEERRTSAEALARQERNIQERTKNANNNRMHFLDTMFDKAQNKAQYELMLRDAANLFMKEQKANWLTKKSQLDAVQNSIYDLELKSRLKKSLENAENAYSKWRQEHPTESPSSWDRYLDYYNLRTKASDWYYRMLYKNQARLNGVNYNVPDDLDLITSKYTFKRGGKLIKRMNYENYT